MSEEKNLKDELTSSLREYTIKTHAQDIIDEYLLRSSERKNKSSHHWIYGLVSGLAVAVLIVSFMLPNLIPSVSENPFTTVFTDRSKKNQTAFSLFSAINIIDEMNDLTPKKLKRKINNDEFDLIANQFDKSYPLVDSLFDNQNIYNAEIIPLNNDYKGIYGTYHYQLDLLIEKAHYSFYSNMSFEEDDDEIETEFFGELVIGDFSYKTTINIERENDEQEVEMEIQFSEKKVLSIEQENESDEIEYEYLLSQEGNVLYEKKLKVKHTKTESKCSLSIETPSFLIRYTDINIESNGNFVVSYRYLDGDGKFKIEISPNGRRYIDEVNNFEKIFK